MIKRPIGLILMCFLVLLNSVIMILNSSISLVLSIKGIPCEGEKYWTFECLYEPYGQFLREVRAIVGIFGIVLGSVSIFVIRQLWNMKKKGLSNGIYLFSFTLIGSVVQLNFLGVLLSIVFLLYLDWRKDIFKY